MSTETWHVEPLGRKHDRRYFDCGDRALNEYLACYARQNQESGIARTFVSVRKNNPKRILSYYSLTVSGIDKINLPSEGHPSLPQESTLHFFSCLPAGVSAQFRLVSALIPMGSGRGASRRVFKRRLDT